MPRRILVIRPAAIALLLGTASALVHPAAAPAGCPCGSAADEFRAADAGLIREWIVQVPFDSATSSLEHVVVGDGLVVAQSGDGGVHAIRSAASGTASPRAGTVAWSRSIGAATGHAWTPTVGSRLVVVTSEAAIHALERDSGDVEWERPTDSLTAGAAMQSGRWVYTPLQTNRLLRLPVNPLGKPAPPELPAVEPAPGKRGGKPAAAQPSPPESLDPISIEAGGDIEAAPLPLGTGALWSTSNGLVALERTPVGWFRHELPDSRPPSWVRRPPAALAGPPVVRGSSIFIATSAGGLARVDLNAEDRAGLRTAWTARLFDRAASGPLVSGETVVVSLGPAGIAAFSAADGRELWRTDFVGTLVATAGGRVWLLDQMNRLTALDLATGSRRQSLCLGCFTLPVVNTLSERIVLASPGGLVVSLAPPPGPARPVTADDRPPAAPAPADPAATPP